MEHRLKNQVYSDMKTTAQAIFIISCLMGCASTPPHVSAPDASWPSDVSPVCPERRILPECFRRTAIKRSMRQLSKRIQGCYRPDTGSLLMQMTIETKGGKASCVAHTPANHTVADCVARVVARHLAIPDSPRSEHCKFRFPIRFESSQHSK